MRDQSINLLALLLLLSIQFTARCAVISGETGGRRAELVKKEELTKKFEKDIENLLESSGNLSLFEIRQKVDNLVAKMDDETRKRHEEWKLAQHERDNGRRERIKNAIMKLSSPAQSKLIRIIFVQEDEELPQNEKRRRLAEINKTLNAEVRQELIDKLKDENVLTDFGFY